MWEFQSSCNKSSVVASEMSRPVHLTKKEKSHWQTLSFHDAHSPLLLSDISFVQYFPTQNKVSVCQWDEDEKDKFSSVWSNDCLNGLSICLLIAFPPIQIHVQWRSEGGETKMQRVDEIEKCESCCYFTLRVRSDHRPPWFVPAGRRGDEPLLSTGDWCLGTFGWRRAVRIWPEKGSLLAFFQPVCCSACILLEGMLGLLMGMHSDPLRCRFSSAGVTHL